MLGRTLFFYNVNILDDLKVCVMRAVYHMTIFLGQDPCVATSPRHANRQQQGVRTWILIFLHPYLVNLGHPCSVLVLHHP
jgi:hypothetical protein